MILYCCSFAWYLVTKTFLYADQGIREFLVHSRYSPMSQTFELSDDKKVILNLLLAHLFEIVFVEEQENGETEPFSIGNEVEKQQELKLISLVDQVQVKNLRFSSKLY